MTLQNWGYTVLLLLLWGFYALGAGDLQDSLADPGTDGVALSTQLDEEENVTGLIVTFVWAYTDTSQALGAYIGATAGPIAPKL